VRPSNSRRREEGRGVGGAPSSTLVQCPLCAKSFDRSVIQTHGATCEGCYRDEEADVQCPVCLASFPPEIIEGHAARCGEENGIYV
jgi:uncharacterized protein (DUF2225 family)